MKNYLFTLITLLSCTITVLSQNSPSLIIDNISTQFSNVSLPYWLKAGQTINLGTNAKSLSILEFTVNGTALEFSRAVSLNSVQTVPANKVWKIEGIGLVESNISLPTSTSTTGSSTASVAQLPTIFQSPKKFETPGTYNWKVPPGVTSICIEVWGAGGGGSYGGGGYSGGGGGGGGYGYQCFTVVSGTNYLVTVGAGGIEISGGNSSVGSLLTAFGGSQGTVTSTNGIGGVGGNATSNSSGLYLYDGGNGGNGIFYNGNLNSSTSLGGNGGIGGNGSPGGIGKTNSGGTSGGGNGTALGGGGGGGFYSSGGSGARGQVYIYW